MISCKKCGCVNLDVNRFCRNCASSLEGDGGVPVVLPKKDDTPEEEAVTPAPLPVRDELSLWDDVGEQPSGENGIVLFPEDETQGQPLFDGTAEPVSDRAPGYIDFDVGEAEPGPVAGVPPEPIDRLRGIALTPTFTVFAILATGGFVLTVLNMLKGLVFSGDFLDLNTAFSDAVSAMYLLGFSVYSAYNAAPVASVLITAVRVLSVLPSALFFIGIWMSYGGALRKKKNTLCGGLNFLSAGCFIFLAGYGLSLLGCVLMGVMLVSFTALEDVTALIPVAVLCAASVVGILYSVFAMDSLSKLKSSVREGFVDYRMSVFVMAVNVLCAIGSSSVAGFSLAGWDFVAAALAFINMLTFVLITMIMVKIRIQGEN